MHSGTVVDATLIAAPTSTKNQNGRRYPEMHQNKKGNEWYFGMKVHAGIDAGGGYVHTITGTSANVRPQSIKIPKNYAGVNWEKQIENRKFATRARVEHLFLIVKKQFGYCKTVYRGIAKNMNRFNMLFASANLIMCARVERTKDFCSAMV